MADLPTEAQRLNDTEISNNAPVTTTLFQRIGSNINFLLDFLGISNGETAASGDLFDLIDALTTITANPMSLQATITFGNGVQNVGNFTHEKYLNQVFYLQRTKASSASALQVDQVNSGSTFAPLVNFDSGGNQSLASHRMLINPSSTTAYEMRDTSLLLNNTNGSREFSRVFNTDAGVPDYLTATTEDVIPFCEVDWRDFSTDFDLFANSTGVAGATISVYREFKLNVGALGF